MDFAQILREKKALKAKKKLNKELVKIYPWLLPRNVWTDKIDKEYDYSYLWIEPDENGWMKAFFYDLMNAIKEELAGNKYADQFCIYDFKSKYGSMRLDASFYLRCVDDYEHISEYTCEICGRPDVGSTSGWITPICRHCYETVYNDPRPYEEAVDQRHSRIPDSYTRIVYDETGERELTFNIKDKADKIRHRWNLEHPEDRVMIVG